MAVIQGAPGQRVRHLFRKDVSDAGELISQFLTHSLFAGPLLCLRAKLNDRQKLQQSAIIRLAGRLIPIRFEKLSEDLRQLRNVVVDGRAVGLPDAGQVLSLRDACGPEELHRGCSATISFPL